MRQKKYLLPENEIPTAWFNIQAIMPNKPLPFLHPGTRQPLKPEDLYPIFVQECANQELNQKDEWIEIPEEIRQHHTAAPRWFVLTNLRRLWVLPHTYISRTRASRPQVHTSLTLLWHRPTTLRSRVLPT